MEITKLFSFYGDNIRADHCIQTNFSQHIRAHNHQVCELLFVKRGDITYIVEDKQYRIGKNTLIISRPLETHSILVNDTTTYDRYDILFDEKLLAPVYTKIPRNINVINFNGNEMVCSLFGKMDYYCNNSPNETLAALLLNLTGEVLYNILLSAKDRDQSDAYTINPVMTQAIQYINDNITTQLHLEQICETLYITKSHLHHLFIVHLNISPHKYILSKKLQLAQKELQSGVSPSEVYTRYGFVNYTTFYRNYKQMFGTSPANALEIKKLQKFD